MSWHFHTDQWDAATDLVQRFHYSRRMPVGVFVGTAHEEGGLFGDHGPAVAACSFQVPPTRWSETVLELTRLVRRDDTVISLSSLVAWCIRTIRRSRPEFDLIVSFADATRGHHGGIYQACSWRYHGQRGRAMDGLVVNGRYVPRRTCYDNWGTSSPTLLAQRQPGFTVVPHFDDGKHLYWLALTPNGQAKAQRLELSANPYPKPNRAGSIVSDAVVNPHDRGRCKTGPGAPSDSQEAA